MKTTIELAREAAGDDWGLFREFMPEIHRLAELIRADERENGQRWYALHKMAEESRTIGLRLDDWAKIDCVNHDCDKCKAEQPEEDLYDLAVRADNEGQP